MLAALFSGCATTVDPRTTIDHRLRGTGQPVVVFQSGLGDGLSVWQTVSARTETMATTLAYSRSGYGSSPAVHGERSACAVAKEQHTLLQNLGLKPPFVLVGHSLGGLYQYAFAKLYPQEVAGVVLLEPTHPDLLASLRREVPASGSMLALARFTFSAPMRREFDDQTLCLNDLAKMAMPPAPVRLLVRGSFTGLEAGAFETVARRLEQDWLRLLGTPSLQRVERAGHYIQKDRPDAVVDAVAAVLDAARPVR